MIIHVLACDYDGTVAERGHVAPATARVLARVRESGRKLFLVTGRMLGDLRRVCPEVDEMFDAIVAENGAVVYVPGRRETRALADAPEPALVDALSRRRVPFDVGQSIVATSEPFAEASVAAIREAGVERTVVFNKGSAMLLPGGVTKGTGLEAALAAMALSPHNMAGIGDAENDHAFLAMCECAVAVADAVPALRERADYVTRASGPRGVVEFVEEHLLGDLAGIVPSLNRHDLTLGETTDGEPVALSAHGTRLLVVGPSASGKSSLTGVLVERIAGAGRQLFLIDPEGDYQTLAELEGIVVLGGQAKQALPTAEEVRQLLRRPETSLVLDLSALARDEKVGYATQVLGVVTAVRSATGLPHWLLIDEAHHILPSEGSTAADLLAAGPDSLCLITLEADALAPAVRPLANVVASTEITALERGMRAVLAARGGRTGGPAVDGGSLGRGEAALAWLAPPARVARFTVAPRKLQHRRHVRKYAEGELPPDRSFYFRGPKGTLNLRAANLTRFAELAQGLDEGTWTHHLGRHDYSMWMRDMIKDPELADEVAVIERARLPAGESRRRILERIRRRYTI